MDQTIRRGWRRDEDGWWSCDLKAWSGFNVGVTEEGQERLFCGPVNEDELKMVDLLQYATDIYQLGGDYREGGPMTELAKVLGTFKNPVPFLKVLITWKGMRKIETMAVLKAIASNKLSRLTRLCLNEVGLDDWDFGILGGAAESGHLSALKYLNLSGNPLRSGHGTFAKAIDSGHMLALEILDLVLTGMGDAECEAYAVGISAGKLPKLKRLALQNNDIGDDGLRALADSFEAAEGSVSPKLIYLDLSLNSFTEVGLLSLAKALSSGRLNSLEVLHLNGSWNLSEESASALVSVLCDLRHLIDVSINLDGFPASNRRLKQLIKQNKKMRDVYKKLEGSPLVPATFSKVYICGNPLVGKTTLSKTLQRSWWESLWTWETRRRMEERTRGIDVSQVSSKGNKPVDNPLTLLVWDMAGQNEYHLLHNSFFPDPGSAMGKATTFVIVCSSQANLVESKQQLIYWLRFIASSCGNTMGSLRHVFVVVNNIGGDSKVITDKPNWKELLVNQREIFKNYLDINVNPFVVDVRKYQLVQDLKECLVDHSRRLLRDQKVPKICQFIEKNLHAWSNARKNFPVLRWQQFVKEVHEKSGQPWAEEKLEAATKYLNEAGVLVYVGKDFGTSNLGTHKQRLVVLNSNWFCKDIAGKMFLHQDMIGPSDHLFRKHVNRSTGSVSISEFKEFFKYSSGEWSDLDFEDIITILLWSGLCYQGRDQNMYIPALIAEDGKPMLSYHHGEHQWVMGFTIGHKKSSTSLAPIALWHRFQVELAQTPKFNGDQDNTFNNGRYFMTTSVSYMNVLIQVSVDQGSPTFDDISIFVKPLRKEDDLDGNERKQCQVDLAKELVEILVKVWDNVCPGIEYLEKAVWPWPACRPRPKGVPEINFEIEELKRFVQDHGLGIKMNCVVGSDTIARDQLLSTKDKEDLGIEWERRREVGEQGIFLGDVSYRESIAVSSAIELLSTKDKKDLGIEGERKREVSEQEIFPGDSSYPESVAESGEIEVADHAAILRKLDLVDRKVDYLHETNLRVLKEQKEPFHKLQNTLEFFWQDWKRTCPIFIYLGDRNSESWIPWREFRLYFACEAMFSDDYSKHAVKGQQGLDMRQLKDWAKTILPWLKVSFTIVLLSANVAAHVLLPGMGWIIPNFAAHQMQWFAIAGGVASGATFSKQHLDEIIMEVGVDVNNVDQNPQELYGENLKAIEEFYKKLTPDERKKKVGLRKVCLYHGQDSLQKIAYICDECFEQYRRSDVPIEEL